MKRWLLALVSVLVGLLLVEGSLRLLYLDLPSLDALRRSPYKTKRFLVHGRQTLDPDLSCSGFVVPREERSRVVGKGSTDLALWAIGDSLTWGMGVEAEESYPYLLAGELSAALGEKVRLRNLAMPGAGFCQIVRQLNTGLQNGTPDIVMMGLFADDLEHRAWLAFEGETIGLPDQIENLSLRWWARRSYAVNLAWFATAPRTAGTRRLIDPPGQASFIRNMRRVERDIAAGGGRLVVAVLPPAGLGRCDPAALIRTRCGWMRQDMHLIARLLDEAGIDYVDLREIWDDAPDVTLPTEQHANPPIHPNAEGHALISAAIWAKVAPALVASR